MILVPAPVKHDGLYAAGDRSLRDCRANHLGAIRFVLSARPVSNILVPCRGGGESHAARVINHLRVDMVQAAEDAQPRPLFRAGNPLPQPQVASASSLSSLS